MYSTQFNIPKVYNTVVHIKVYTIFIMVKYSFFVVVLLVSVLYLAVVSFFC